MDRFFYIEELYKKHKKTLIEVDGIRPSKSIPRDIFSCVNKFESYYLNNKHNIIPKSVVEDEILSLNGTDTFATNIRVMREFNFIEVIDDLTYKFTKEFEVFANSKITMKEYFLEKLTSISNLKEITMVYNIVICVLREGIIYGDIVNFPDSKKVFESKIPHIKKRVEYCKRVKEIYGFEGRNGDAEVANYTPNANYRIITTMKQLNLIEKNDDKFPLNTYTLTSKGIYVLERINNNFASKSL